MFTIAKEGLLIILLNHQLVFLEGEKRPRPVTCSARLNIYRPYLPYLCILNNSICIYCNDLTDEIPMTATCDYRSSLKASTPNTCLIWGSINVCVSYERFLQSRFRIMKACKFNVNYVRSNKYIHSSLWQCCVLECLQVLVCLRRSRTQQSHSELWIYWFMDWGPGLVSKTAMQAKGSLLANLVD